MKDITCERFNNILRRAEQMEASRIGSDAGATHNITCIYYNGVVLATRKGFNINNKWSWDFEINSNFKEDYRESNELPFN